MKRCLIIISLIVFVGLMTDGAPQGDPKFGSAEAAEIKLFNGPPQGTWRPMAVTLQLNMQKGIPDLRVNIEPGGGASNVIAANDQPVWAMAMASSSYDGFLGNPPYTKKMTNIRQVAILFSQFHVIMTTVQTGITTMEGLKGKRVNVQQRGYASELVNQMILSEYKLTYKDIVPQFLGENDAIDALKDGHIDANMASGISPYPPLVDLMTMRGAKLLIMSDTVIKNMGKRNQGLIYGIIPGGTYSAIKEDIPTINTPTILIVNKDVPEDFVHEITKVLTNSLPERQQTFDFLKKMKPEEMSADVGIPFHPGALRYYKERGWAK